MEYQSLVDDYSSGFSMKDIAYKYNVSIHKVAYWMDKYAIPRRNRSEATYIKSNPTGDPFKITDIDSPEKSELLSLGIGLYMGEGSKKHQHQVRFTNSDPTLIRIFLKFLRDICCVNPSKVKAWLNVFDDVSFKETMSFWLNQTQILEENFMKPTIRPHRTGTYKSKSPYGTLTIIVCNTNLLRFIKEQIAVCNSKYA